MGFPKRVKQGLLFILERTGSKRAKCWSRKGSKRDFVHENIRRGTNAGGGGGGGGGQSELMEIVRARTHARPSSRHPDRPYGGKRRMKTDLSLSALFAQELRTCARIVLFLQSVAHSSQTLTHTPAAHHSFTGSLCWAFWPLWDGQRGLCVLSVCGQDVASTSHSS